MHLLALWQQTSTPGWGSRCTQKTFGMDRWPVYHRLISPKRQQTTTLDPSRSFPSFHAMVRCPNNGKPAFKHTNNPWIASSFQHDDIVNSFSLRLLALVVSIVKDSVHYPKKGGLFNWLHCQCQQAKRLALEAEKICQSEKRRQKISQTVCSAFYLLLTMPMDSQ